MYPINAYLHAIVIFVLKFLKFLKFGSVEGFQSQINQDLVL